MSHEIRTPMNGVIGMTGLTEKQAGAEGITCAVMYMAGASHAGYYPGAEKLLLKILYDPSSGRLLGAQALGKDGVDKRIDVLATALQAGMTVEDLEHLDLCYAPPFGSARDVVVEAGFAAANVRRDVMPSITPQELLARLQGAGAPAVIDVRSAGEYRAGHLGQAVNIPLDELRRRLEEVPSDRPVAVHCGVGYRSYLAQRILANRGRSNVRNVLGGYAMIQQVQAAQKRTKSP
jgi:rhodanese-related sulfurtransferase